MDTAKNTESTVLESRHLAKIYGDGPASVRVLEDVNLRVVRGERVAIVGASGCGKSTLLHLLGGLDLPSAGEVYVCGERMAALSDARRGRLRNRALGFVYQFHHLLPEFSALENVAIPLAIGGSATAAASERAASVLGRVGLGARLKHKPSELSGGERQRVAIARALVTEPRAVLADEPTGNLDRKTAERTLELMTALNKELETALIVVTHDTALARQMDAIYLLDEGVLTAQ